MDIRSEIKNILKEVFSEAAPSIHFGDRIHDRLTSTLYTRPAFDYNEIDKQINIIKNTNFDPEESFAVFLKKFPVTYVSKDPFTGTPSIGDEVWAVVRNNVITTIFFRNSSQRNTPVKDVDNTLDIKALFKNYTDGEKNPDGTVDFSVNTSSSSGRKGPGRKRLELNLPIVDLDGSKWYIDQENEKIIFAKNIKKELSFDDLKEEYLEKIIDAVTM
jgi:hypothetical protein